MRVKDLIKILKDMDQDSVLSLEGRDKNDSLTLLHLSDICENQNWVLVKRFKKDNKICDSVIVLS